MTTEPETTWPPTPTFATPGIRELNDPPMLFAFGCGGFFSAIT
jgi:hypothetical protein